MTNVKNTGQPRQPSNELPAATLESFVEYYFNRRQAYLRLYAEYGRPLYVLEPKVLTRQAGRFKKAFQAVLPDTGFYFAVKSNNHPEVARALVEAGFGLDVSSGLELQMALGVNAVDIVFSGPGKTADELSLAVGHPDRVTVLIDSFEELRRLENLAAKGRTNLRAGVRLCTNPSGLWRKFGILPAQLPQFYQAARQCPHVFLQGLQFHTSWNLTPAAHTDFIRFLGGVLAGMPEDFLRQLTFIDIGGGYWPEQGEWLHQLESASAEDARSHLEKAAGTCRPHYHLAAETIEVFAGEIGRAIAEHLLPRVDCRICFEPGRWICHQAMQIVMRVQDKKGDDLVITDAGTNAIGWERFETDYFPVLNLTRPSLTERPCQVLGALCTPHDVWGFGYFGQEIHIDDILLVPAQGAYTYSLRQHFIKPLPEVVILAE